MFLTKRTTLLLVVILASLSIGVAWGATPAADTLQVNYFINANTAGAPDGTVQMDNPGTSGNTICAMIYVFDPFEELSECCGCTLSPDDLRTISVNGNLTANALTGPNTHLTTGLIKVVSSKFAGVCDPRKLTPTPSTRDWATHIQSNGGEGFAVTEEEFLNATLSSAEQSALQSQCSAIVLEGSGHGICTCGAGA